MARRRVSGSPRVLGFTTEEPGGAIALPTPQGEFILEVPPEHIAELMHAAACLLPISAKQHGHSGDPPALPAWAWQLGSGRDAIHARFQIVGGGAYAFSLSKKLAMELHSGLGEALGYRTERTHKPN